MRVVKGRRKSRERGIPPERAGKGRNTQAPASSFTFLPFVINCVVGERKNAFIDSEAG